MQLSRKNSVVVFGGCFVATIFYVILPLVIDNRLNDLDRLSQASAVKSWKEPSDNLEINVLSSGAHSIDVAVSDNGDALFVWSSKEHGYARIYKSEYRNSRWSHTISSLSPLNPLDGPFADYPRAAMDAHGNAVIVWAQSDTAGEVYIYKTECRDGRWSDPSWISQPAGDGKIDPSTLQVVMSNEGRALIVWGLQDGRGIYKIESWGGIWAPQPDKISLDSGQAFAPHAVMNSGGNAIIVWRQDSGYADGIFKSEYRDGRWKHPGGSTDRINPDSDVSLSNPQVAMSDNGDSVVVWGKSSGEGIYKVEYRSGVWSFFKKPLDKISPSGGRADDPRIAMNKNGDVVIVWSQSDELNVTRNLYKSEYRSGTWSHPASLEDKLNPDDEVGKIGRIGSSQVAMDADGNAIIVWDYSTYNSPCDCYRNSVYKSEYREKSWTHPISLASKINLDGKDAWSPRVVMGTNGDAIINFQKEGHRIYSYEYR